MVIEKKSDKDMIDDIMTYISEMNGKLDNIINLEVQLFLGI